MVYGIWAPSRQSLNFVSHGHYENGEALRTRTAPDGMKLYTENQGLQLILSKSIRQFISQVLPLYCRANRCSRVQFLDFPITDKKIEVMNAILVASVGMHGSGYLKIHFEKMCTHNLKLGLFVYLHLSCIRV